MGAGAASVESGQDQCGQPFHARSLAIGATSRLSEKRAQMPGGGRARSLGAGHRPDGRVEDPRQVGVQVELRRLGRPGWAMSSSSVTSSSVPSTSREAVDGLHERRHLGLVQRHLAPRPQPSTSATWRWRPAGWSPARRASGAGTPPPGRGGRDARPGTGAGPSGSCSPVSSSPSSPSSRTRRARSSLPRWRTSRARSWSRAAVSHVAGPHSSCSSVAHRPCSWSRNTCSSDCSRLPLATTALPFWWTSSISAVAFSRS